MLFIPIQVSVLVNEAARDINFYMQKAPLFDFTILNSSPGYGSQTESVFSGSFYFSLSSSYLLYRSSTGVAAEELLEVIRNIRQ